MGYVVGTDEAGYGPNLGPLVVSATVWQVHDGCDAAGLDRALAGLIARSPGEADRSGPQVIIGDSKVLYQSGKGLGHLERGLWAAMALLNRHPQTWRQLWDVLAPGAAEAWPAAPWFAQYDVAVPLDARAGQWESAAAAFHEQIERLGIRLVAMRSRAVFPDAFNRLLQEHDSKGSALSHVTLGLAAGLIDALPDGPVAVVCDKHGGRDRYGQLLAFHFPDRFVEICGEGRARSVYRLGPPPRRIEFCFQARAESCVAAAMASMASKYLRELAMRAWNEFWCQRVEGLRPTAGYPADARRFKDAIAATQRELGIEDAQIWREK